MNQGHSSRYAVQGSRAYHGAALLAALVFTSVSVEAHAQDDAGGSRRGAHQPLDGPNLTMDRDLAAGALIDSLVDPLTDTRRTNNAATRVLGGQPSKATVRPQWTARLARNPKKGDGNPPYALIDRYGGIQRYVEEVPNIDLENYVGQTIAVRRDTGHTLLASQLDLPRRAGRKAAPSNRADGDVQLAAFEEMPAIEPTPADEPPSPTGERLPQPEAVEGEMIEGQGPIFSEQSEGMIVPDGVDPLYLDGEMHGEELHMDGCDNCGSKVCAMQGGCGLNSRPVLSVRAEYLLWWADGMAIPPLVVRGEADNGDFVNAFVVYGDEDILDEARSGARLTMTYWLDDYGRHAIEGDYFGFGQIESHFVDGGDGTFPIVGRPFFDILNAVQAVQDVSFPGIRGTVTIDADSEFQSAGIRLRRNLCCVSGCSTDCGDAVTCGSGVCGPSGCGSGVGAGGAPCLQVFNKGTRHVDVTYGVRWAQLDEGINIREDLEVIAPSPPLDIGTTFLVNDNFSTSNEFLGGELGFLYDWQYKRWSLEFLSRLAVGRTEQRVAINGFTVNTPPGGPADVGVGGLLALSSNIGDYERNELSVIPQLGFTGGYMLTDRLKLTAGYTFLYWSRVARPGDQIDLDVNTELLPNTNTPGDGLPARPQFVFRDTDFWAHGINAGLEYSW
ncbi:MAG: BBP7 family outer membrane beta-barrel protein [Pirellulales bacterium]|nr:BBP7 family outer membrane beta-barrel protein [Pirellulales bacterium]